MRALAPSAPAQVQGLSPRRGRGALAALIVVAALAGCGGDDTSDRPVAPATTEATTTLPAGPGLAAPEVVAFCSGLTTFAELTANAANETLEELQGSATVLALAADELAASGPAQLEEPLDALAQRFGELDDVIAQASTVEEARAGAQTVGPDPLLGDAGRRIGDYADAHCPT